MKPCLFEFDCLDSTNAELKRRLGPALHAGAVVVANNQTAGRGQRGKTWLSAPGCSLTFSQLLRPKALAARESYLLNQLSALAVLDALLPLLPGAEISLKWPNDVLVNNRKIAGLLLENQLSGAWVKSCIVGIGLNVNQTQFPNDFSWPATSLRTETGSEHPLADLREAISERLTHWGQVLDQTGSERIRQAFSTHLYRQGQTARFYLDDTETEGVVVGVQNDGRLRVRHGALTDDFPYPRLRHAPPSTP